MTTTTSTPSPSSTTTAALAARPATLAVITLFTVNGLLLGGNGGALPSLREKLAIGDTQVALLLFCAGVAGIVSMQVGGRLADAIGAPTVALTALPVLVAAAVTIALAPSFTMALVGLILLGLGNGAMDVSMNALGVQ